MKYPSKLEVTLTQACIDLHNARNIADVESVLSLLEEFDQLRYAVPEWLTAWIILTMQNPLLTAEEHFKMPKPSVFVGMRWKDNQSNDQTNHELIEQNKLEYAIQFAGCDSHIAMRNVAFMIASRTLMNATGACDGYGGGLGYEWHCKTTQSQLLEDTENLNVLVQILQRETGFWQQGVKARAKVSPRLQPLALA